MIRVWVNRPCGVPLILGLPDSSKVEVPVIYRSSEGPYYDMMIGTFQKYSRKGFAIYKEFGTQEEFEASLLEK